MNTDALKEENEQEIDLIDVLHNIVKGILRFGWIVILLAVLTSCAWSIISKYRYEPVYTATANFAVKLNLASDGTIDEDNLRASQMSATFPYIITSGVLKNIIASDLGLASVNEKISADNVIGTNLFTIMVKSRDAHRAYQVLQSVIKNYPKVAESVVGSTYLNMIEESGVPTRPSNRQNIVSTARLGALPGVALGLVIIAFYALTRKTIMKTDDLLKLSNIKHLGTLPKVVIRKRKKYIDRGITIRNNLLSGYRDSIYRIRTRIEKISAMSGMKSILVTSAIPGEGKSTVALNLALSLAEEGKKVLLVDFDLYKPSIKQMLPFEEEFKGLEMVLKEEAEPSEVIRYFEDMRLSVLACSEPVADSAELVGTDRIKQMLTKLKESFDYVILDTAPAAILSDTSDLAKHVDGAVYVIRQDFAKVDHVLEGLEHLSESSGIHIMGFVFNCANEAYGSYGYGKYGHYGYGKKKHGEDLLTEE